MWHHLRSVSTATGMARAWEPFALRWACAVPARPRTRPLLSWLLRACVACGPRRPDDAADALDLLLAYSVERNPSPAAFAELLARAEADT